MRKYTPLTKPFKTALRTVTHCESVLVRMTTSDGRIGWGEAPATIVITGDSLDSIESAIIHTLSPVLLGQSVLSYEHLFQTIHTVMVGSSSAKAALDMAIYDLLAQYSGMPLYQFLGGYRDRIETDFTVSVGTLAEMADDAERCVQEGFNVLKIKVGKGLIEEDIARIKEIRSRVGSEVKIRLDANQGWQVKDAVRSIRKMEDLDLNIELVEQPVRADDLVGLKTVTDSVETLIMADESVFSPAQALEVLQNRAADLINIKLMKAGGIYKAQIINQLAEVYGVECMVGSMIESKVAVTAAAHFAASKKNITRFDFDAPLMMNREDVRGGVIYNGRIMRFSDTPGLGIADVQIKEGMEVIG
ncbi:dipeptide epimerase [Neobacillus mesonae]|nr:dipeptide epimerase [Neobacillus mesonae]